MIRQRPRAGGDHFQGSAQLRTHEGFIVHATPLDPATVVDHRLPPVPAADESGWRCWLRDAWYWIRGGS